MRSVAGPKQRHAMPPSPVEPLRPGTTAEFDEVEPQRLEQLLELPARGLTNAGHPLQPAPKLPVTDGRLPKGAMDREETLHVVDVEAMPSRRNAAGREQGDEPVPVHGTEAGSSVRKVSLHARTSLFVTKHDEIQSAHYSRPDTRNLRE